MSWVDSITMSDAASGAAMVDELGLLTLGLAGLMMRDGTGVL